MNNTSDFVYGVQEYESASIRAFWQEILGHLRGKPVQLLSFDDVRTRLRLHEESYKGLHNIPLDAIVGSVGRYKDFIGSFLPKSAVNPERWSRIYAEMVGEIGLPPIEVYRVSEVYFVRDGNHRVSVARALKFKTIQAYVTEVDTPLALNRLTLTKQMDAAEAYVAFLDETGLRYSRPNHESLMLSEPSRYGDLIGHLNLHRSVLAEQWGGLPGMDEAAAHWYDNVYIPAVDLMRSHDVLKGEKGRTEADLYLWLVEHLCEIEICYTGALSDFSPALAAFLRHHRLPVPPELLEKVS
ncbi:MAG: transcriptional regulator [Anaerolineae bacterium]|nr:transcriptional regulator [Anaerolineae bacterium]